MTLQPKYTQSQFPANAALTGVGLRAPHYNDFLSADAPDIGWLEVHPENYFGGGLNRHILTRIAQRYPISLHGVGLSLGADQPVSTDHLDQLKSLTDEINPFYVSDHASWSASGNAHLNDLLPLPYTQETLDRLCRNIDQTQNHLQRQILLENPSTYIDFTMNEMSEAEFMVRAAEKTGCALLLDINNIYVQSHNHGLNTSDYLSAIPADLVKEIHLAGHIKRDINQHSLLIDTHSRPVTDPVWDLYKQALQTFGAVPTLIEWDQDIPDLSTLIGEATHAQTMMERLSC